MAEAAEDLKLLRQAAAEAAALAMRFFRRDPEVWWKEGNSPVSEADLAVNTLLKERLLAARPDYGWLSEESAASSAGSAPGGRFFVVDPIDGTRAFLRGEATWCVSLAVVAEGRPVAGVIDAPVKGEVFAAMSGGGARLNGEPLVLPREDPGTPLRVAMPDAMRRRVEALMPDPASLTVLVGAPSLAYRLAQVAAGRIEGTLIRPQANDWDIAAGDLILEEAGGALAGPDGEKLLYKPAGRRHGLLVAAAPHAADRLRQLTVAADMAKTR